MTAPLVSVVMCTYNGRAFVEAAVADILAQSYANWELIISDDGSTDGTREWLQSLHQDERIRTFLQPRNLGYVRNKNFAVQQARGELITQQDQDDRSDRERLRRQVEALQSSGLEIAACGYRRVNGAGETTFEVKPEVDSVITQKGDGDYPFWFPALLVSRRVYDEVGLFSDYFAGAFGDDLYWTVRANQRFPIICLADILYTYRDAPGSITSMLDDPRKLIMGEVLAQLLDQRRRSGTDDLEQGDGAALQAREQKLAGDRRLLARQYRTYAARCIDQGRFADAWALLRRAMVLRPWRLSWLRTLVYLVKARARRG